MIKTNKKSISTKKSNTVTKENKNVNKDNATASALLKKVSSKERSTKTKDKNFLYKFQIEESNLNSKDQKKKRNKIRRQLKNLVNSIISVNLKGKKETKYNKDFINFYKANYILNDFSLSSLTNKTNEEDINDYTFVLTFVKENI